MEPISKEHDFLAVLQPLERSRLLQDMHMGASFPSQKRR